MTSLTWDYSPSEDLEVEDSHYTLLADGKDTGWYVQVLFVGGGFAVGHYDDATATGIDWGIYPTVASAQAQAMIQYYKGAAHA